MTLNFLGLSYNVSDQAVATSDLHIAGTYRGRAIGFTGAAPTTPHSAIPLRYRGVTYLR